MGDTLLLGLMTANASSASRRGPRSVSSSCPEALMSLSRRKVEHGRLMKWLALVAAAGVAGMATFQILLALGLPLGHAAFGGTKGCAACETACGERHLRTAVLRGVLCCARSRRALRPRRRIRARADRHLGVRGTLWAQHPGEHRVPKSLGAVSHGTGRTRVDGVLRGCGLGYMNYDRRLERLPTCVL